MKTYRSLFALIAVHSLLVATSDAAIIYSGLQNIAISTSFDGTYLDVDTGLVVPVEGAGWDINPFFGGEGIGNSPSFQPVRASTSISSAVQNLAFGQMVTASSIYASGFAGSDSHIGLGPDKFISGDDGYIGFKFLTNGNDGPFYGWMRLNLSNTGASGFIRDWAYDDSGASISVGAVPETSSILAVTVGSLGFCFRRRR